MATILAIDVHYPHGFAANLLYVGVILLGLWAPDLRSAMYAAAVSTALSLVGYHFSPAGGEAAMGYFNLSISVLVLWVTAVGVSGYRHASAGHDAARRRGQNYLDIVSVAVRVLDPDGRVVLMNRRGLELLGRPETEVVGRPWHEFIHPDDQATWREALDKLRSTRARSGAAHTSHRSRLVTPRGRMPVVEWSNVALVDDRGRLVGTLSSGEDITPRLKAEGAFRRSLKDLAAVKRALDQSAIVATTDVRGDITYVNQKFCEISKYSRGELIGRNHRILSSGLHPTEFFKQMYATIGRGQVWRGDIRNRAKDGAVYWVETTIVPFLDERGHPYQYIAIRYDITGRKAAEAALREQESLAQLGKMAAVVAHEVRNPLAGIRGAVQVIGRRLGDGSREQGIAAEIITRIDALNNFVQDLLQFARPWQPTLASESIDSLLRETISLLREDPALANVEIQVEAGSAIAAVDREQLKRAMLNLLMNSAQAMQGTGRILVSSRRVDRWLELRVVDEGPGIPTEIRDRLFEPFLTTKHHGTGLGLATTRRILEAHHGTIELECPADGGTVAIVRLPAEPKFDVPQSS